MNTSNSKRLVRSSWLLGPAPDLLCIANILWPLLALGFAFIFKEAVQGGLKLWLSYLLVLPHRFITLAVLVYDRERILKRKALYGWTLGPVILVFLAIWWFPEYRGFVLLFDMLWNNWHAGGQHAGIAKIYERFRITKAAPLESSSKWLFRGFILYTQTRFVTVLDYRKDLPLIVEWINSANGFLHSWDILACVVVVWILARGLYYRLYPRSGFIYLASVLAHYSVMLVAVHFEWFSVQAGVSFSNGIFHGLEYLAIVAWFVRGKDVPAGAQNRVWIKVHWRQSFFWFIYGVAGAAWFLSNQDPASWLAVATLVSFIHYTLDGMIWKMRDVVPIKKINP